MWLSEPQNLSISHDLGIPPEIPLLEAEDLHLVYLPHEPLEDPAIEVLYHSFLSLEEKERVGAIKNRENQSIFVQSRARLRWLLGHQLGVSPSKVPLIIGPHGKPHHRFNQIEFNLSHTSGAVLIGIAKSVELGVDVEQWRYGRRLDDLIGHVFSPIEQRQFEGLGECQRRDLFLRGWTLKEAWVKASGRGIAAGLSRVVIRGDFQGFDDVPIGDPNDYQVFESAILSTRIALVYRGETRRIRFYRGNFES